MRVLGLEGAANFRDIGGYVTGDGLRLRWGRAFRSNKLSLLNAADRARLDTLGLRTVFDLRVDRERQRDPTCWRCEGLVFRTYPPGDKRPLVEMAAGHPGDESGARALMAEFYGTMPFTLGHAFGGIIREIANGAAPCVIHCSAGKDRTGVAVALILLALGVPRDTVIEDYALTQTLRRPDGDMIHAVAPDEKEQRIRARFSAEAIAYMMSSPPEFLETALGAIEERHGSVEAYLRDALELDDAVLARLRAELLE